MSETTFWESWSRCLINGYSFSFTVFAAIVGLIIMKEYWWISVLIVIATFLSSGVYAFCMHRETELAKSQHQADFVQNQNKLEIAAKRLRELEQKLSEVPYEMMVGIQRSLAAKSFADVGQVLIGYAQLVARMSSVVAESSKPINLRAFKEQGGCLFAIAKAELAALQHIRPGDPFLLVKKSSDGLETPSARLLVHQPPDYKKEVIMFRIAEYLSDEMGHMEHLARSGDVQGIKGYEVQVIPGITNYQKMNVHKLEDVITRLVQDVANNWKVADD